MAIKFRINTTEVLMIIDFSNEIVNVHQMSLLQNIQSLNFRLEIRTFGRKSQKIESGSQKVSNYL